MSSLRESICGTAWIHFQVTTPLALQRIRDYCRHSSRRQRYELFELPDDTFVLAHHPNNHGQGTAPGNAKSDFLRMAAYAIFRLPISQMEKDRDKDFPNWDYRSAVAGLVPIIDAGTNAVELRNDANVTEKIIYGTFEIDLTTGRLTGWAV